MPVNVTLQLSDEDHEAFYNACDGQPTATFISMLKNYIQYNKPPCKYKMGDTVTVSPDTYIRGGQTGNVARVDLDGTIFVQFSLGRGRFVEEELMRAVFKVGDIVETKVARQCGVVVRVIDSPDKVIRYQVYLFGPNRGRKFATNDLLMDTTNYA